MSSIRKFVIYNPYDEFIASFSSESEANEFMKHEYFVKEMPQQNVHLSDGAHLVRLYIMPIAIDQKVEVYSGCWIKE